MDPRCEVALVLAKIEYSSSENTTDSTLQGKPQHMRHTVVIVPIKTAGVTLVSESHTLFIIKECV
jgi:hypothetical protein